MNNRPSRLSLFHQKTKDMHKDTNFIGLSIFSQLLKSISKSKIDRIALKNKADRYTKKLLYYFYTKLGVNVKLVVGYKKIERKNFSVKNAIIENHN